MMGHKLPSLALALAGAFTFAGLASTASAKSAVNSCSNTITKCGCTISKAGNYQVTGALDMTTATTADCIDITASKVNLRLDGHTITGNGSGAGINILKSAANANLQLADPANPATLGGISNFENGIVVQGKGALLNGFDVSGNNGDGLLLQGSNCSVMNFYSDSSLAGNGVTISGSSGCQISDFVVSGNGGAGVALINAKTTTLEYFNADDSSGAGNLGDGVSLTSSTSNTIINPYAANNGGSGLMLTNSSKNILTAIEADGNAGSGIALAGSSSNTVFDFFALDNAVYGAWLASSSSNTVRFGNALGNAQAGVYLGCAPTAVGAACSAGAKPSIKNTVTAIIAGDDPNLTLPQAYGVAVDLGDLQNNLSGISALIIPTVTNGDATADLFDANANCGTNIWFANAGAIASPAGSPSCTEPTP